MTIAESLILGLTQGLTEFLPVSSSGHLVLVPEFFNLSAPTLGFDIMVHLATLVAVLGYFWRDVGKILMALFAPRRLSRQEVKFWRRMFVWLVVGSIPAAVAGFGLARFFEGLFENTLAVGVFLIVTSLLLWGADFALGRVRREPMQLDRVRGTDAFIIGLFQALAIAPGISRSGSTIAAGVFLGFDRPTAARFSFLLSIPAIFGAFLGNLGDVAGGFAGASSGAYVVGFLMAGITGFLAIFVLMRWVKEHRLRGFGIYTAALGLLTIILSAV